MSNAKKIVTAAEMLAIEESWFATGQITLGTLMDRVGKAIADWVLTELGVDATDSHVLALVGKGNNGGDAIVAARYLIEAGVRTTVATVLPRNDDDPLLVEFAATGGDVVDVSGRAGARETANLCDKTNLILDGVFGFSISRPIDEPIASVLKAATTSGKKVVAIDVPSGANPDRGTFDPNGLPADVCLPVGLHKLGPATRFGDRCYGDRIDVLDVDLPHDLTSHIRREVNDFDLARDILPDRSSTGHKGDFGRSLLLAGSSAYIGAAYLATNACVRSGVGLVALATSNTAYQALAGTIPEATYIPLNEDVNGVLPAPAYNTLQERIPEMNSALIGVGVGLSYGIRELVARLTSNKEIWDGCTVVIDADGITLASMIDNWWEAFNGNLIITPHPGEMSRLLGVSIDEVQADRVAAAETAAQRFNCIAVLKGATTLIASPDGRIRFNMQPNSALARGGTGDVLGGLITGLAAKSDPFDAASLGVFLHSMSGRFAREDLTPYAMTAGDLVKYLPRAFRELAS